MDPGNLSLRSCLLRAAHQWMTDRGDTPQVVVQADREDVQAPGDRVKDGRLVLNIGCQATRNLQIGKGVLSFDARFGGVAQFVSVPMDAVLCIFSRETGEGVVLTDRLAASLERSGGQPPPPRPRGSSRLRLVK